MLLCKVPVIVPTKDSGRHCLTWRAVSAGHSHSRDSGARLDEAPAEAPRTPSWWSSPTPTTSSSLATPTPGARAPATPRLSVSKEHGSGVGGVEEVLAKKEKQIDELTARLGALRDALTEQVRVKSEYPWVLGWEGAHDAPTPPALPRLGYRSLHSLSLGGYPVVA